MKERNQMALETPTKQLVSLNKFKKQNVHPHITGNIQPGVYTKLSESWGKDVTFSAKRDAINDIGRFV